MRTDFISTYSNKNRRGYTLVEVMVVVIIIALIAAMAFPAILMSRENARSSRFINDLRQMRRVFELYALENGTHPAEVGPGVIPAGMSEELDTVRWTDDTTLGGQWDWEYDKHGFLASVAVRNPTSDASTFAKIDARIDDGDLSAGAFRASGSVYFYVVE